MRKNRSGRVDPSASSSAAAASSAGLASSSSFASSGAPTGAAASAASSLSASGAQSNHGRRQLSLLTSRSKDTTKRQMRIPPPPLAPSSTSSSSSTLRASSSLFNKTPAIAIRRHLHPGHQGPLGSSDGSSSSTKIPPAGGNIAGGSSAAAKAKALALSGSSGSGSTLSTSLNPEPMTLGEIYLNDLSDIRVFDLINLEKQAICVQLGAEFRKPFHRTTWAFQLENENYNSAWDHLFPVGDNQEATMEEDFSQHMPQSVLRATSKAALWSENLYLSEAYNELFNQIGLIQQVVLEPEETKRIFFSMCVKIDNHDGRSSASSTTSGATGSAVGAGGGSHGTTYSLANADSSEEERMHLNETSCLVLSGKLVLKVQYVKHPLQQKSSVPLPIPLPTPQAETSFPLQGQVCRSILRIDVKELHFDDCVPGGSYVKDFTVWNRSEIPLLFKLVSSFDSTKESITCTDYNTGFVIDDRTCQAAAYGHVRIRVTYRPVQVGEQSFEVHVQNLHDSRNVKILKIHAIASKEHHREGLAIKEPNGSYLMSGSKLDFGDCYTGVATTKLLVLKNTTEASLHVELTSDRPKEITFELKLMQNRARSARAPRSEDLLLSPSDSNDGSRSSRKGSLSPEMRRPALGNTSELESFGVDSDEEADDNEGDFFDDDFALPKRALPEENAGGELDDLDDDFEFDGERTARSSSPPLGNKTRGSSHAGGEGLKRSHRMKPRKTGKKQPRVRDLVYESGVESGTSACSSPERRITRRTNRPSGFSLSHDDPAGSNFLVETLDLAPGMERMIQVLYCPASNVPLDSQFNDTSDAIDLKGCRLTKQTFRVSFRCFQMQGTWQQAQSRVYDRTLGKSIHIRARTCTSIVTVTPSILHLGDCNIGELKGSSCMVTNHSELPTVVKPVVTSKVISTVPNDEMTLGPKQSLELKVEIIPRKTNPNYSRLISVVNLRNKSNIPQICVRSSNMDAHHVIYHSLFYRLLTQSRSAFLNFEHVAVNSIGIQVFDLENITNAPLNLHLQSSDSSRVKLYHLKMGYGSGTVEATSQQKGPYFRAISNDSDTKSVSVHSSLSSVALNSLAGASKYAPLVAVGANTPTQVVHRQSGRVIRRRRSIGSLSELASSSSWSASGWTGKRTNMSTLLRSYLAKKPLVNTPTASVASVASQAGSAGSAVLSPVSNESSIATPTAAAGSMTPKPPNPSGIRQISEELASLIELFELSRAECEQYCHGNVISYDKEVEIVGLVRERMRRFQTFVADKKLIPLGKGKERNVRISPKSQQRIVAVFSPIAETNLFDNGKIHMEKYKIFITLPPGGNRIGFGGDTNYTGGGFKNDQARTVWTSSRHPFDSRSSVRELLLKSRVCRSVLNVNQKNINFGRITTSSKSSKRLVVQNMSAIPLVYAVEKTGSISSGFLEIKEGEVGVVKAFGSKNICFEFQPTLAGPFEEKLKIVNVQDVENSVYVTIKAKVVKRETFKLLQSGQVISLGKCLVGERSEEVKISVRNTSRKRREYAIQVDPSFTQPNLRPSFYFAMDDAPSCTITQAQERKLDEELEKLEHKLRIAVTKKKSDKIRKLNAKISRVKSLLNGEQVPAERLDASKPSDLSTDYDESGNSESEYSETEASSRSSSRSHHAKSNASSEGGKSATIPTPNMFHFALDAEATCRIVTYVVFQTIHDSSSASREVDSAAVAATKPNYRSQKARKRQLRRESTPVNGVGKFLLYEQQNRDVVKELQYSAEIFFRTPAGETAYCRAVGKTLLPPFPQVTPPKKTLYRKFSLERSGGDRDNEERKRTMETSSSEPQLSIPRSASSSSLDHQVKAGSHGGGGRKNGPPRPEDRSRAAHKPHAAEVATVMPTQRRDGLQQEPIIMHLAQSKKLQLASLVIRLEESPAEACSTKVVLSYGMEMEKMNLEVRWHPAKSLERLVTFTCQVVQRHSSLVGISGASTGTATCTSASHAPKGILMKAGDAKAEVLPVNLQLSSHSNVQLQFRWMYIQRAGFATSTTLASCIGTSVLDAIATHSEVNCGTLQFTCKPSGSSSAISPNSEFTRNLDVVLSRTTHRSLRLQSDRVDLGDQQLHTEVESEFVVENVSSQPMRFLVMTSSSDASVGSGAIEGSPTGANGTGEFAFDHASGFVEPGSTSTVRFRYKGLTPGKHKERLLIRNLTDRLDCSTLSVTVRVTRPVYVRIPGLDPHSTGRLEVLDIGPCYVTPEMQDTSVESPNVSLKFSKVYKLTLQSQVAETLVLSASSNLKTQCYVYEDGRLHREATNVVLQGHESIDLYAAFRPRLPSDAFKTGACRELVGGIRVQLFATPGESSSQLEEEKANMVAEFTIKFVGIAGVSMARVSPILLDFGVENNTDPVQLPQSHEGRFEIANLSKGLPFQYRLFVTSDAEGYSDDDESLHVALVHEKGEIAPGETGQVVFRLMAYTNGLFRRRILIENIHYHGKISYVDVVLFVDNGTLQCDVHPTAPETDSAPSIDDEAADDDKQIALGVVNVIKMNCSLPALVSTNAESEIIGRKYRIFEDLSGEFSSSCDRHVSITNTSATELLLRPLSNLPLIFAWNTQPRKCPFEGQDVTHLEPMAVNVEEARQLVFQAPPRTNENAQSSTQLYYGATRGISPGGSLVLHYRFASVAMTGPLPVDVIESGKLLPFEGLLAIQSFGPLLKNEAEKEASTLKRFTMTGNFGESRIQVQEKFVSLGKVGSASGWKHSRFEVIVKNSSEVSVCFAIANIPKCISVTRVDGAQRATYHACAPIDASSSIPSLRSLALHADRHGRDNTDDASWHVWSLEAMKSCVLELQFVQTEEVPIAGERQYDLRFLNLNNPQNIEVVQVHVQIISSYIEVVVDPESTGVGSSAAAAGTAALMAAPNAHIANLPQIVVPPPLDAPPQGCSFWFSLRNVYDEELFIRFSSRLPASISELMELVLFVRTSNAPVSEIQIAPGESIDIRVVCRVFPSSRLSAEFWKATESVVSVANLQDIGVVQLEFGIAGKQGTTRSEELQVRGRLAPGKTFVLSTSSLHFYATASELPTDFPIDNLPLSLRNNRHLRRSNPPNTTSNSSNATVVYQLKNMVESFWLRNPCTTQALNFVIDSIPMSFPGMCVVKGTTTSEMCAISDFFEAVAVPSSGTIAPGDSVKISVRLEEAQVGSLAEDKEGEAGPLSALHLQKLRHHPSWRSSSWGSDPPSIGKEANAPNLLYLTVRDTELSADAGASTDVEIQLITQNPATLFPSESKPSIDKALLDAAFAAREKKLSLPTSKKLYANPVEEEVGTADSQSPPHQPETNPGTKQQPSQPRAMQLPLLGIRGCTPVENTALECTRFLIDVGQHTIRNGGVVEWEITIEGIFNNSDCELLEYRIHPVDGNVRSWLQLSRDRGTVDRSRNYQSVVLYFLRDVVGLYSTYVVLENLMNPADLKVIHVRLEVIADLNSLRSMSSTLDPTACLFRVLVTSLNESKRHRSSIENETSKSGNLKSGSSSSSSATSSSSSSSSSSTLSHLEIDYGEVYYYKPYHNHSIVLENSSGLSLDFMLSSNARPQELSFSIAPTSYNEVTTITLGAHARTQVFLHLRPLPKTTSSEENERWDRKIEVYVNCRLVKDFRETVVLKVICNQPQLAVNVASSRSDKDLRMRELEASAASTTNPFGFANPPAFLGMVFSMSESSISAASESKDLCVDASGEDMEKFLVVANTKLNEKALIAIRNDTLFFEVQVDPGTASESTIAGPSTMPTEADYLDKSICAGKRPALLVTVKPQSSVVFRVIPNLKALQKHHQLWDHSVKEHMTVYNMKQFAEHYQITMCFTCTNLASFYVPPSISENYPLSTLEDLIAKFLQNYNTTWKLLLNYYNIDTFTASRGSSSASASSISVLKLAQMMSDIEAGLEACEKGMTAPVPNTPHAHSETLTSVTSSTSTTAATLPPPIVAPVVLLPPPKAIYQLLQSFRALYFDFYYITDELVWYGVRGNAVRHSLTLADLAYGVVFANEIFRAYLAQVNPNVTMDGPLVNGATTSATSTGANASTLHTGADLGSPDSPDMHPNGSKANGSSAGTGGPTANSVVPFPALLLPWIRQLRHFLSYFPENQEATLPLRQLYDMLKRLGC